MRPAFAVLIAALAFSTPALAQSPCSTAATLFSCNQWAKIDASMAQLIHQGYSLISVRALNGGHMSNGQPSDDVSTTFYLSRGNDLVKCDEIFSAAIMAEAAFGCERLVEPYKVR
jgi:hypothetical protein